MPLILGTNSIKSTDLVTNSLRFNDGSSDYLNRTTGTATSTTKFTFSTWVKRSKISGSVILFSFSDPSDGNNELYFRFMDNDTLQVFSQKSGTKIIERKTNRVFRDVSAWYHLVLQIDTTHGNVSDRIRIYVNGVQETSFSTETNPNQNETITYINNATFEIGRKSTSSNLHMDGYLAETVFLDGLDHNATFFGEFDSDTNIWKPIDVSGFNFGNNGFYLDFENSGSLGNDKSGNGNNFTVNNLTSIDQSTDTCTNNFATLNPLHFGTTIPSSYSSLSEGNTKFVSTQGGSPYPYYFSTMAVSQGKWYAEFKRVNSTAMIGIATGVADSFLGNNANDYAMYENGQVFTSGSGSSYGDAMDDNDIIGVAMDLDNNKLYFSNQGVFQNSGNPTSGSTGTGAVSITAPASNGTGVYHFAVGDSGGGTPTINCNFGSPMESISSGNTDGNGYGNFEYEVPSGYYALNTKNLAEYG
jgi:hypothetical protein